MAPPAPKKKRRHRLAGSKPECKKKISMLTRSLARDLHSSEEEDLKHLTLKLNP